MSSNISDRLAKLRSLRENLCSKSNTWNEAFQARDWIVDNIKDVIAQGKNDKVTPPHVAEEFHKLFKNSELHWISKCGHAPMWEQPEKFSKISLNWLKKHIIKE